MIMNWEDLYQQGDIGWDRAGISPALNYALAHGLRSEHRLLIPGCGLGHEVVELARCGFDVTGLDIAPSAAQSLEQRLQQDGLNATVVCGDLFDYQPEQSFDAIYEQTCLCAIPVERRSAYVAKLHAWLKQDGVLYFAMMQTGAVGGPPFHCDWMDMNQLFDDEHWQWQEQAPAVIPRPKGKRFELAFRLQRR